MDNFIQSSDFLWFLFSHPDISDPKFEFHSKYRNWISRPSLYCHLSYDSYLLSYLNEHGTGVGRNRPVKLNHFNHGPVWISLVLHILWPIHACDASIFMFTGFKMNFLSHQLVFFLVHPYIWLEFIYSLVPCLYIEHKIEPSTARITTRLPKLLPIFKSHNLDKFSNFEFSSIWIQTRKRNNYVIMSFVFSKMGQSHLKYGDKWGTRPCNFRKKVE